MNCSSRRIWATAFLVVVVAGSTMYNACSGTAGRSGTANPVNPVADPNPSPSPSPTPGPTPSPNPNPGAGAEAVFVANAVSNSVSGFIVELSGAVGTIIGSPFALPASPTQLSVARSGAFLFATTRTAPIYSVQNPPDFKAVALTVNHSTGALAVAHTAQLSNMPLHHAMAASGRFLYAASNSGMMAIGIDSAGGVREIAGSPFAMLPGASVVVADPAASLLYCTFGLPPPQAGGVQGAFFNSAAGAVGTAFPAVQGPLSGAQPSALAFHRSGNFVAAAYATSEVAVFAVTPSGRLTPASNVVSTGGGPSSVTFDPAGRHVFVATPDSNSISVYAFDAAARALSAVPGSPFATGGNPVAITVSPSGRFVFTANQAEGTMSAFRLESSGALTLLGSFAVGAFPVDVIAVAL